MAVLEFGPKGTRRKYVTPTPKDGDLTGKSRYRISFFGKVVLQLECYVVGEPKPIIGRFLPRPHQLLGTRWRDATRDDMKIDSTLQEAILAGVAGQLK